MKIVIFLNALGLGGTEKAALLWAEGLQKRGHTLHLISLLDGPRRKNFENLGIEVTLHSGDSLQLQKTLQSLQPDLIHAHCPGFPHTGDILGAALAGIPKIPVVQTNIFGRLDNPRENQWTDFRLFVSRTSAIQAALAQNPEFPQKFFENHSYCSNPLLPEEPLSSQEIQKFRESIGVRPDEILWGRIARPETHKWSLLSLVAFRLARKKNQKIKLLLREPPPGVALSLQTGRDREAYIILKETDNEQELKLTLSSLQGVLHATLFGESFGYTLAEAMALGIPSITNSTPWGDQAQLELIQHHQTGIQASIPETMREAILELSNHPEKRIQYGQAARQSIQKLANIDQSVDRLESIFQSVLKKIPHSFQSQDYQELKEMKNRFQETQFGHHPQEKYLLNALYKQIVIKDTNTSMHGIPSWLILAR